MFHVLCVYVCVYMCIENNKTYLNQSNTHTHTHTHICTHTHAREGINREKKLLHSSSYLDIFNKPISVIL